MDFTTGPNTPGTQEPQSAAKESSIETFSADVMEASQTRPIVVEFYASWSEASKEMSANLAGVMARVAGAIGYVRVDVDKNQTLIAQLRVQSAPTVIIFFQGQPVDGFQGPVPAEQLTMMMDRLLQATGGTPQPAEEGDPIEGALSEFKELKAAGQSDHATMLLNRILEVAPDNKIAQLYRLEALLEAGQSDALSEGLSALSEEDFEDKADKDLLNRLNTALALAGEGDPSLDTDALEGTLADNPLDHDVRFTLALTYQARGDLPKAAEALLGIVMRDREWEEEKARKQLVKLFDAAGPKDPFTLKYRRRLSSVMFS